MKNNRDSIAPPAEEIVLEGRFLIDSATGVHKVLFISEDEEVQKILNSDLALIEDDQAVSGLNTRNHAGYDPYARTNAASKNPKNVAPRPPRFCAKG